MQQNDVIVGVRMPRKLKGALERERRRMSRAAGAEVKMSAVIRALLEQALSKPKQVRKSTCHSGTQPSTPLL